MSIKPIDLQTLFVKMDEVSKEQSHVKEQSALQQAQAARAQVTRELEDEHRVIETPEDTETQAVKDDESETGAEGRRKKEDRSAREEKKKTDMEVVTDPDVGRHVDLSG